MRYQGEVRTDSAPSQTEALIDSLREAIIDGEIPPGTRLTEAGVAAQHALSRHPARLALSQLAAEGFVEHVPNRGSVVRAHRPNESGAVAEVRLALEILAARAAAVRRSNHDVRVLRSLVAEARHLSAPTDAASQELEIRFHGALAAAAQNPVLGESLESLWTRQRWMRDALAPRSFTETWDEHDSIVEAVVDQAPARAERRMRAHLDGSAGAFADA